MRLAITDANIFIDLIHIGFVEHLFKIGFEIHTCAEVLEELNEKQQGILLSFSETGLLTIHTLSEEDQKKLALPMPKSLSNTDVTVILLATKIEAVILSGDNVLRKYSEKQEIEVHGVLWLFDQFIEKGLITHGASRKQLEKLIQYNDRLPKDECDQRLKLWGGRK